MIPPHDTQAPLAQAAAPAPTLRTYWAQWTLTDSVAAGDQVNSLLDGAALQKRVGGALPNIPISAVHDSSSGNFGGMFLVTDPGTFNVFLDGVDITANTTGAINSPLFVLDAGALPIGGVLLVTTDNIGGS